jgi:hypothetical protein
MSATEDEAQRLDAGWGDDEPSEDEVDDAWDSVVPSLQGAAPPSVPPPTDDVDRGWDDAPVQGSLGPDGKRRPHRQRRAKAAVVAPAPTPVVRPRPAENTKKQQREHQRKLRAQEARAKEQRKLERKEARLAEATERQRRVEVEEQAKRERAEAQARERAERQATSPKLKPKPKSTTEGLTAPSAAVTSEQRGEGTPSKRGGSRQLLALLVAAGLLAALSLYLLLR